MLDSGFSWTVSSLGLGIKVGISKKGFGSHVCEFKQVQKRTVWVLRAYCGTVCCAGTHTSVEFRAFS